MIPVPVAAGRNISAAAGNSFEFRVQVEKRGGKCKDVDIKKTIRKISIWANQYGSGVLSGISCIAEKRATDRRTIYSGRWKILDVVLTSLKSRMKRL